MTLKHPSQGLLDNLDGFRVEIDEARSRADIILDRPPLNVVSMPQRDQLRCAFEALDAHPGVRVIVLRAAGEHFSSGGDIKGFLEASPEQVSKLAWNVGAPARCEKPVVAANRGYCFGVGFEISLACDFRIASETALYALPEQKLGQIPGSGGSARLQKMIGITRSQGRGDAFAPHRCEAGVRLGHRDRVRARRRARARDRRAGGGAAGNSRRSRSARQRSC